MPDYVVNVDFVEVFKKRLDKFWSNQPVKCEVKVHDINAGRRDSFGLLQSVLMNVIGLYVSCKFGGNVKLLMYDEL